MRQFTANRTARRLAAAVIVVGCGLLGLAGCSSAPAAGAPGFTGTSCGTTRTGANVPVVIKVTKGTVDCPTAMRVEQGYATLLKQGDIQGNGGGAPVTVNGWTCQGYPTPQVLRTGAASECHTATAEVAAVLALPSTGS